MANYSQWHMPALHVSLSRVLKRMLNSGFYYPLATWAFLGSGKGLDLRTFECIWKAVCDPETITLADIMTICFQREPGQLIILTGKAGGGVYVCVSVCSAEPALADGTGLNWLLLTMVHF